MNEQAGLSQYLSPDLLRLVTEANKEERPPAATCHRQTRLPSRFSTCLHLLPAPTTPATTDLSLLLLLFLLSVLFDNLGVQREATRTCSRFLTTDSCLTASSFR
ncbi:hypothetical protein E2C01_008930 [Portunus trituberculatus]|uniref:Uncharacterized protein n=1 Tax=Portunus trituberculatus TaxID=210409 RepID=A0A5B7D5M8_PORTR|nr:hypothetical protein [Portunus trituberculatus]